MPKKRFTTGEVKRTASKLRIEKPIGYMDRRWNLALDTLVLRLEGLAEKHEAGYDPDDNLRPLKMPDKRKLP